MIRLIKNLKRYIIDIIIVDLFIKKGGGYG